MTTARAKVLIVGGDPAINRSLEALLQAMGYDGRFQPEPLVDGLGELLADSCPLLVAPDLRAESREALTNAAVCPSTKSTILQLIPLGRGEVLGIRGVDNVHWPCPMEELRRRIRAALLARD